MTLLGEDDPFSIASQFLGRLKLICLSVSDLIISKSKALTDAYLKFYISDNKLIEIPCGVDTNRFKQADFFEKADLRKKLRLPLDKKIFLFVGIFSKRKGLDLLINAWKEIKKATGNKAILVIIGSTDATYYEIEKDFVINAKIEINAYDMDREIFFIEKSLNIEEYFKASDKIGRASCRERV